MFKQPLRVQRSDFMQINPISFTGKVIHFNPKTNITYINKRGAQGDTFVRNMTDIKAPELNDYNTQLRNILKDLRTKKNTPEQCADRFIEILKDKNLRKAYDREFAKLETTPVEELDISASERFYDLTFNIRHKLDKTLEDRGKNFLITTLMEPYDCLYEDYIVKCDEIFGDEDEDDDEQRVLILNSLVDIDNENTSEEQTKEVITEMTECLKDIFAGDDEAEFNVAIKIDGDYDENKFVNACKNLFKLVTMTRENAKKKD